MISKLPTGGIDLPKLARDFRELQAQMFSTRGVTLAHLEDNTVYKSLADLPTRYGSLVERLDAIDDRAEETNAALADHIGKANELVASRALVEDVETLRMKLDRIAGEVVHPGEGYLVPTLATTVADLKISNANLSTQVASLSKQVEALTATKLSEVKARKAPKKDAAK